MTFSIRFIVAAIEENNVFVLDSKYSWYVRKNVPLERLILRDFLSKRSCFLALLILGALLLIGITPPLLTELRYAANGVDTDATVADVRLTTQRRSNRYGVEYNVSVVYVEYVYRVGRTPYSKIEFYEAQSSRESKGDILPIRYLSDSPETARWLNRNPSLLELYGTIVIVIMLFLLFMYVRFRREAALHNKGRLIDGVIEHATGMYDSFSLDPKAKWVLNIRYSFPGELGLRMTGHQAGEYNRKKGYTPEPGTPVKVLYVHEGLYKML